MGSVRSLSQSEKSTTHAANLLARAMATSAAPGFFQKWLIGTPAKPYVDGALLENMPVKYALDEKDKIWPPHKRHRPLDTLVSVGTGVQLRSSGLPGWLDIASIGEVAKAYYDNVIDAQQVWKKFTESSRYDPGKHIRLNVALEGHNVELDDWLQMDRLINIVNTSYDQGITAPLLAHEVEKVAYKLTANLLFFEPDTPHNRTYEQKGFQHLEVLRGCIWCPLSTAADHS